MGSGGKFVTVAAHFGPVILTGDPEYIGPVGGGSENGTDGDNYKDSEGAEGIAHGERD
jgi:hypothetical protein